MRTLLNANGESHSFRRSVKLISLSAKILLLIGSYILKGNGYQRIASICFILACVGIASDLIMGLFFKHDTGKGSK